MRRQLCVQLWLRLANQRGLAACAYSLLPLVCYPIDSTTKQTSILEVEFLGRPVGGWCDVTLADQIAIA